VESVIAVSWSPDGQAVRIVDQRALPRQLLEREVCTLDEIRESIRTLAVRGAPAIGVFAALGLACVMQRHAHLPRDDFDRRLEVAAERIRASRPTAVNLGWAVDRLLACARATPGDALGASQALRRAADAIRADDIAMCERIGERALPLLPDAARILTHCNTGALATAGIGTALAPVYLAQRAGHPVHVYVTETRPLLQGSRLTAWELERAGVSVTLLTDNAAALLMRTHEIDCVLVGADRIAANGDVANKIGTYGLAILARHHGVPFYVAAPTSTIDRAAASGAEIPIEQRDPDEVRQFQGVASAPQGVDAFNPAFDVTPGALIGAIVTDRAVHYPPYDFSAEEP
jgi:methylthioribose-1-phosphate isomerase